MYFSSDFSAFGLGLILAPLAAFLFSAATLKLGARLAGLRVSLGRALLTAFTAAVASFFVGVVVSLVVTPPVGFVVGVLAAVAVIRGLLETSWRQAFLCWLFFFLAHVVVGLIVLGLTGWGLMEIWRQFEPRFPGEEIEVLAHYLPWA